MVILPTRVNLKQIKKLTFIGMSASSLNFCIKASVSSFFGCFISCIFSFSFFPEHKNEISFFFSPVIDPGLSVLLFNYSKIKYTVLLKPFSFILFFSCASFNLFQITKKYQLIFEEEKIGEWRLLKNN